MITLGLIINPLSGIGGAVGLKGSDGTDIVEQALALGAQKKSLARSRQALQVIADLSSRFQILTCPAEMGEELAAEFGFSYRLIDADIAQTHTSADDTRKAAQAMLDAGVDLLVFAGGDGTARDICAVIGDAVPVIGIPAGVKIHSGVYGITPLATGNVIRSLLCGELVDVKEAEVRDLDEDAFRNNQVRARHYGDMRVPQHGHFVQAVKQGGVEDESLVLVDIAAYLCEEMEDDVLYLIGSGKTTQAIMDELGLENTLLGVDAVCNRELVGRDLSASQLLQLSSQYQQTIAVVSVMGGQGHIFGRGNQQLSPALLHQLGKQNIRVISTKTKIAALNGRPLIMDSGDPQLDQAWSGTIEIITGYRDHIVHTLA
ncbi:ATP-NAD kinase family protein [Thalassolituus marinus]|uniref:ATP-NAD kinase family protein n=1 Tax=Thalassolituus marinus TaxID=671053 RepID=A0ABS7ZMA8_9GAMM|nr:ATP-NAD kinase family protein [Thalassolituus marinus]MCA6062177.1 ATP-NAD kinase family protein [Thalassolituus marinus]